MEDSIEESYDELIKTIPNDFRKEILGLKSIKDYYDLKEEASLWFNLSCTNDEIDNLIKGIRNRHFLHYDDFGEIFMESLIDRVNKRDVELEDKIESYIIYWKEHNDPPFNVSPEGGGEIDWIWKLPTDERESGTIHVGLDVRTRRFLCFERTKGVYFPEGPVMERIRAEIVQDTERAREHVGKGYLKKAGLIPEEE